MNKKVEGLAREIFETFFVSPEIHYNDWLDAFTRKDWIDLAIQFRPENLRELAKWILQNFEKKKKKETTITCQVDEDEQRG